MKENLRDFAIVGAICILAGAAVMDVFAATTLASIYFRSRVFQGA